MNQTQKKKQNYTALSQNDKINNDKILTMKMLFGHYLLCPEHVFIQNHILYLRIPRAIPLAQ